MLNLCLKKYLSILVLLLILIFISGCTSHLTESYINAVKNNQPLDTKNLYQEELKDKGRNQELYLMEKGRIAQLEGDYSTSKKSFSSQIDNLKAREIDDDTLPGAQINVGSVVLNDNALPYKARLFETEMLYLYQTYNYLAKGSLEDALVETRISDYLMNEANKAREDEKFTDPNFRNNEASVEQDLYKNEAQIKKDSHPESINPDKLNAKSENSNNTAEHEDANTLKYQGKIQNFSNESFEKLGKALEKSKSSVLNPYVFYVSGLIHEMGNELDDAYISYKNALMLVPQNYYLQKNVIRLAIQLNKSYDFDWLEKNFSKTWKTMKESPSNKEDARLVVIYEDGWIPRKKERSISLIAVRIAYPIYDFEWKNPQPLIIENNNSELGVTDTVCYMSALAVRALKEEQKWRVIRQSSRAALKGSAFATGAVMSASGNDAVKAIGLGVMTASSIYNNASEKADLRCWMSLPDNAQIFDTFIKPEKFNLKFKAKSSNAAIAESASLKPGQTTVLWLVNTGPRIIFHKLWPSSRKTK